MAHFVISESDVQAYGCPHCNYGRVFFRMSGGNATVYTCPKCGGGYQAVVDGETHSSWDDHPPVVPHPRPTTKWV